MSPHAIRCSWAPERNDRLDEPRRPDTRVARGLHRAGDTPTCPYAAARHNTRPFYGVQFHPEVTHTPRGEQIFQNFLYEICHCSGRGRWATSSSRRSAGYANRSATAKVICGLSGGVDSSVVAALLHKAIGEQLVCIFVDKACCGKTSAAGRIHLPRPLPDQPAHHDAAEQFLQELQGVTDPQQKRKIIGREFIEAFKREAKSIQGAAIPGPGDAVSGRDRIRPRLRRHRRQHQAPPQRRRPARAARF